MTLCYSCIGNITGYIDEANGVAYVVGKSGNMIAYYKTDPIIAISVGLAVGCIIGLLIVVAGRIR